MSKAIDRALRSKARKANQAREYAADILQKIAAEHLGLQTLETRNSDEQDFSDLAVWNIKAALEAAYEAGRGSAR